MAINPNLLDQQEAVRNLSNEQLDGILQSDGQSPVPGFLAAAEMSKRAREYKAAKGAEASERLKQQVANGPTVMDRISNEARGIAPPTPMPQGMAPQATAPAPQGPPDQALAGGGAVRSRGLGVHGQARDLNSVASKNIQNFSQGGAVGNYNTYSNGGGMQAQQSLVLDGQMPAQQGLVLDGQMPAQQQIINFNNGGPVTNSPYKEPDRYFQQGTLLPSDITHYNNGGAIHGFHDGGAPGHTHGDYDPSLDPIVRRQYGQYSQELARLEEEQAGREAETLREGETGIQRLSGRSGPRFANFDEFSEWALNSQGQEEPSDAMASSILHGPGTPASGDGGATADPSIPVGGELGQAVLGVGEMWQNKAEQILGVPSWRDQAPEPAAEGGAPEGPLSGEEALRQQILAEGNGLPPEQGAPPPAPGLDDAPETPEERTARMARAQAFAQMAVGLMKPGSSFLGGLAEGTAAAAGTMAAAADKIESRQMAASLSKQKSEMAQKNYEQRASKIENDLINNRNRTKMDVEEASYEQADLLLEAALASGDVELPQSQRTDETGQPVGGPMGREELASFFYRRTMGNMNMTTVANVKKSGGLVGGATIQRAGSR